MELTELLTHEAIHGIVGVILGLILYIRFNSKKAFLITIVASFLIDLDHLLDYFVAFGFNFHPSVIPTGHYFDLNRQAFVLFHSWEITLLLLGLGLVKTILYRLIYLSMGMGMFGHLIIDQVSHNPPWYFFFISVRFAHDFLQPKLW